MTTQELVSLKREELISAAVKAQSNAYCPVSKFSVGASLLTNSGEIYAGANVENASLPCGWCAEVSAVANAVSQGHRNFIAYAVSASSERTVSPCGRCRQVLAEFADPGTPIFMRNSQGVVEETKVDYLLPLSFSLKFLSHV
ncbi:cytidine deaminase [Paragonimus westermani]|uniref:Cytidine deaminase n=1 Tax=Paragonimus westermani TaxID=34504 RepID=A0A5J4NLJ9_9TREM|nr:cytidine deaminase [Paragonimus westermani]